MGAVLVTPDPISPVPFGRGRGCVWTAPSDQGGGGGGTWNHCERGTSSVVYASRSAVTEEHHFQKTCDCLRYVSFQ